MDLVRKLTAHTVVTRGGVHSHEVHRIFARISFAMIRGTASFLQLKRGLMQETDPSIPLPSTTAPAEEWEEEEEVVVEEEEQVEEIDADTDETRPLMSTSSAPSQQLQQGHCCC